MEVIKATKCCVTVVAAVELVMKDWLERYYGPISYLLTQVITVEGCIGDHLYQTRKESTLGYLHALAECTASVELRRDFGMVCHGHN